MSKIVAVTFDDRSGYKGCSPSSKRYHYRTDLDLQVGDQCVVDSPYGGATVVTVQDISPSGYRGAMKWIISKVDRERFEARRALEGEIEKQRALVEEQVREAMVQEQRRQLAERYPAVKSGIDTLASLEAALARLS